MPLSLQNSFELYSQKKALEVSKAFFILLTAVII